MSGVQNHVRWSRRNQMIPNIEAMKQGPILWRREGCWRAAGGRGFEALVDGRRGCLRYIFLAAPECRVSEILDGGRKELEMVDRGVEEASRLLDRSSANETL